MKIEKIKINLIQPNQDNPRIIKDDKFEKLVKSIKEFPKMLEIRPIVVNENLIVLGGNMRLKACIEAGLKEIPIIKAENLSQKQQREFIVKDNVGFGEWDWDMLKDEWDNSDLEEWGLDTPFDEDEILEDIEEIKEFNESTNFTISCANMEELEQLQTKLNTEAMKIDYSTFLLKAAL
jgi:hypothetical protein